MQIVEKKIKLTDVDLVELFGSQEANLQLIENKFDTAITVRGDTVLLRGEPIEVKKIEQIFQELSHTLKRTGRLQLADVSMIVDLVDGGRAGVVPSSMSQEELDSVILWGKKEMVRARTPRQMEYYRKVRSNDLVF
ncbi:MAG: PhoH family protein, partial [Candidatus Kapabacteria bacterium]|nr:PhoH family protein [Candidatus Kapabacteria bacterium]